MIRNQRARKKPLTVSIIRIEMVGTKSYLGVRHDMGRYMVESLLCPMMYLFFPIGNQILEIATSKVSACSDA
jgi:hypothetical protein